VLFRLEVASVLPTLNPTYECYELSQEKKEILAKNLTKFSETERPIISSMGARFEDLMH